MPVGMFRKSIALANVSREKCTETALGLFRFHEKEAILARTLAFASKACIVMSSRLLDGMTLRQDDTDDTVDAIDNLIADMFGKRFSCEKLMS